MGTSDETIVAVSSAVGAAARIVVRMSGAKAWGIGGALCPGWVAGAGRASREWVEVEGMRFGAWVYGFTSPRSYTGEDLVELHLPGNEVLARMVLDRVVELGGRHAEAGEFTARAYFNGRMDLTEAEGVAGAVAASNEEELRAARQLMAGGLAKRLRPLMDRVAETLGLVEVGIDFSEEEVTFLSADEVRRRAGEVEGELEKLVGESDRMERLGAEPVVVMVGRPNAGKSTLLNALAGVERAVVSPVAGTTRDVLSAEVALARGMIRLVDAAGIGEDSPPPPAATEVELAMRGKALEAVEGADVLLLVVDLEDGRRRIDPGRNVDLVVRTKADLAAAERGEMGVSAVTGEGLGRLREALDELAFGGRSGGGDRLALNRRHLASIEAARGALGRVREGPGGEFAAMELREALDALGGVLGVISPDDVLGLVFSRFCIGK